MGFSAGRLQGFGWLSVFTFNLSGMVFFINLIASLTSYIIHVVVFKCLGVEINGPRIRARYVPIHI